MEIILAIILAFVVYTFGYNHGLNEERRKSDFAKAKMLNEGIDPDYYFEG